MSLNKISPTTITSLLVAETYTPDNGSPDTISQMTQVDGVTVDAALEVQSESGGILFPRLTQGQIDNATVANGMAFYNSTSETFDFVVDGEIVPIGTGSGDVSGPDTSVVGNIATFADVDGNEIQDSGVSITSVPAPLPHLLAAPLVDVNQISNLGHVQFINGIGIVFVDSLVGVQYIENDFGPENQVCSLITGDLPGSSTTPSALLELQSTTGALLLSRMTTAEINALTSPTNGMMVYNTTVNKFMMRENGFWVNIDDGGPSEGTVTSVDTGSGLTGGPITTTGTISLDGSGVFPGVYFNPNLTVDFFGRIIFAVSTYPVLDITTDPSNITTTGGQTPALDLSLTGVTAGSYTNSDVTVDSFGRITSISNGSDSAGFFPPTYNNQLMQVSQGASQGGFGGGSVGTNLTMSTNGSSIFDLSSVDAGNKGFFGGCFDGRHVYFSPYLNDGGPSGQVVRYDSTAPYDSTSSYEFFDTLSVNANSKLFVGSIFADGYVYYIPQVTGGGSSNGQITRYNTSLPFTDAGSYEFFDTESINPLYAGYWGAVYDGRYIYFVPSFNDAGLDGIVVRYDTMLSFTSAGSYQAFDLQTINAGAIGFSGGTFDGRYVYFAAWSSAVNVASGVLARYDTSGSFASAGSFEAFNVASLNADAKGYHSAVFDGRYVYYVPFFKNISTTNGLLTRYDTTQSFSSSAAYTFFDTTVVSAASAGYDGGTFDGRYLYLVQGEGPLGTPNGQITRYDTTKPFDQSSSYSILLSPGLYGYSGAVYDGKYIYCIPKFTSSSSPVGFVQRVDAYSGPQLTTQFDGSVVSVSGTSGNITSTLGTTPVLNLATTAVTPGVYINADITVDSFGRITSASSGSDSEGFHAPTYNNQLVQIAQGYTQGGFGSSAVGTNKIMSSASTSFFDTTTVNVNSNGFWGSVFDGRYLYTVPNLNGQVTRYDTTLSFTSAGSYAVFDTTTVNVNSAGFVGGVFDGRYIYFVPFNGQVTRYDTTASFTSAGSYAVFDTTTVNANSKGFWGAVFDGRYVYFVPQFVFPSLSGQVTRYDTTASFTSAGSYAVFDTTTVNGISRGFSGGAFDGRYVYYVPNALSVFPTVSNGQITRYDTSGPFTSAGSYAVFNTTALVSAASKGFSGAVFDGRYIYFVPDDQNTSGQVTRYDTTLSFTSAGSYAVFDTTTVNVNSKGFFGGVFDGRYIYYVPNSNPSAFGQVTRYDVTKSFTSSSSYEVLDTTALNANSLGFRSGMYDGQYVYLIPFSNGQITRITAYSGPPVPVLAHG